MDRSRWEICIQALEVHGGRMCRRKGGGPRADDSAAIIPLMVETATEDE